MSLNQIIVANVNRSQLFTINKYERFVTPKLVKISKIKDNPIIFLRRIYKKNVDQNNEVQNVKEKKTAKLQSNILCLDSKTVKINAPTNGFHGNESIQEIL